MATAKVTLNPASTPGNAIFDFELPQGEKGDPGGLVTGAIIVNGSDLNSVKTSGVYQFNALTGALNLPPALVQPYGQLLVVASDSGVRITQTIDPTASSQASYLRFERTTGNGGTTWSPWRTFNSTRVDQTAGRAIYQWDELNNREQFIYGDTGWRDITPNLAAGFSGGVSGNVQINRYGKTVEINLNSIALPDGYNGVETDILTNIPIGFRLFGAWEYRPARLKSSNNQVYIRAKGTSLAIFGANGVIAGTGHTLDFTLVRSTNDPWPTTLPGTAVGAIPNL